MSEFLFCLLPGFSLKCVKIVLEFSFLNLRFSPFNYIERILMFIRDPSCCCFPWQRSKKRHLSLLWLLSYTRLSQMIILFQIFPPKIRYCKFGVPINQFTGEVNLSTGIRSWRREKSTETVAEKMGKQIYRSQMCVPILNDQNSLVCCSLCL